MVASVLRGRSRCHLHGLEFYEPLPRCSASGPAPGPGLPSHFPSRSTCHAGRTSTCQPHSLLQPLPPKPAPSSLIRPAPHPEPEPALHAGDLTHPWLSLSPQALYLPDHQALEPADSGPFSPSATVPSDHSVLLSCGGRNKGPQIRCPETTEIHALRVLEAACQGGSRARLPLDSSKGSFLQLLGAPGSLGLGPPPSNPCFCLPRLFLCVSWTGEDVNRCPS